MNNYATIMVHFNSLPYDEVELCTCAGNARQCKPQGQLSFDASSSSSSSSCLQKEVAEKIKSNLYNTHTHTHTHTKLSPKRFLQLSSPPRRKEDHQLGTREKRGKQHKLCIMCIEKFNTPAFLVTRCIHPMIWVVHAMPCNAMQSKAKI
jgi:hypothetical protein